jgi:hypothetical protein
MELARHEAHVEDIKKVAYENLPLGSLNGI